MELSEAKLMPPLRKNLKPGRFYVGNSDPRFGVISKVDGDAFTAILVGGLNVEPGQRDGEILSGIKGIYDFTVFDVAEEIRSTFSPGSVTSHIFALLRQLLEVQRTLFLLGPRIKDASTENQKAHLVVLYGRLEEWIDDLTEQLEGFADGNVVSRLAATVPTGKQSKASKRGKGR